MATYRVCCHVDLLVSAESETEARVETDRLVAQFEHVPEVLGVTNLEVVHAIIDRTHN